MAPQISRGISIALHNFSVIADLDKFIEITLNFALKFPHIVQKVTKLASKFKFRIATHHCANNNDSSIYYLYVILSKKIRDITKPMRPYHQ